MELSEELSKYPPSHLCACVYFVADQTTLLMPHPSFFPLKKQYTR